MWPPYYLSIIIKPVEYKFAGVVRPAVEACEVLV